MRWRRLHFVGMQPAWAHCSKWNAIIQTLLSVIRQTVDVLFVENQDSEQFFFPQAFIKRHKTRRPESLRQTGYTLTLQQLGLRGTKSQACKRSDKLWFQTTFFICPIKTELETGTSVSGWHLLWDPVVLSAKWTVLLEAHQPYLWAVSTLTVLTLTPSWSANSQL